MVVERVLGERVGLGHGGQDTGPPSSTLDTSKAHLAAGEAGLSRAGGPVAPNLATLNV